MRPAEHKDIDYFVRVGEEFCKNTPYTFDADGYSMFIHGIIKDPDSISIVNGDPVICHCAAKLVPSFYDPEQIVCRVFTTWGKGGLECFREVERLAVIRGADFILADSYIEPRIMRFYEHICMRQTDSVFIKEVQKGH